MRISDWSSDVCSSDLIVLCDTDGIRAPVVASWLKQLGWNVSLLQDPQLLGDRPVRPALAPALAHTQEVAAAQLAGFVTTHPDALILDARPSALFRKGSLQGARWTIRPMLLRKLEKRVAGPVLQLGDNKA